MIETTILANLIHNEEFGRKVLPFLKDEYFHDIAEKSLFKVIKEYIDTYNAFPTKEALIIELNAAKLNENIFKTATSKLSGLAADEQTSPEWLLDKTEKFCQDKAIHNGLLESIKILDDSKTADKGAIPKILQDALNVSFDQHIGHDFLMQYDERFTFYNRVEERLPTDIDLLNKIMNGGAPRKTLNMIMAPTGVGKTLIMCHMAASNLMLGKNVLYLTLEMAEERIAERIDANLLDIPLSEIALTPEDIYRNKIMRLRERTVGKLIIKEYPTASAGAHNFRFLLNELRLKKNFVPDAIYIDYINLCASSRVKMAAGVNSYSYIKAVAEEIRGLAGEFNVPIWSATQTNRGGFQNSDFDMDSTSDSFGLPMTVDFMLGVITSDELQQLGQYMFKQLKNRYGDPNIHRKFVVGVDKPKMRLFNVDESAQDLIPDVPVMDKGGGFGGDAFDFNKIKDIAKDWK